MVEIVCSNCSEPTARSGVKVEEVSHEGSPDIGIDLTTGHKVCIKGVTMLHGVQRLGLQLKKGQSCKG